MKQNDHLCPSCGGPNQCAIANGLSQACWCFSEQVDAARLAALPPQERGTRCLCRRCATAKGERCAR